MSCGASTTSGTPATPSPARRSIRRLVGAAAAVLVLAGLNGCIRYQPDPGTVALTFDDGPHPTWTPQVLDVLDRFQIRATFFVVAENVEQYPNLAAEIQQRGHSVQNHTYTHPDLVTLSNDAITTELTRANDEITDAGAAQPACLRPPYGSYDQRVDDVAAADGLELVLWDVDTRDWSRPGVPTIVDRAVQADGGDIVLLHDGGGDRSQTVRALPEIISELDEQGYDFQTLCIPVG